jgi:hypothetical protein
MHMDRHHRPQQRHVRVLAAHASCRGFKGSKAAAAACRCARHNIIGIQHASPLHAPSIKPRACAGVY